MLESVIMDNENDSLTAKDLSFHIYHIFTISGKQYLNITHVRYIVRMPREML